MRIHLIIVSPLLLARFLHLKLNKVCKLSITNKGKFVSIDDSPLIMSSECLNKIKKLVEAKIMTPTNDKCYPFEQIIDAHRYVELGHKKGNVATITNATWPASLDSPWVIVYRGRARVMVDGIIDYLTRPALDILSRRSRPSR